MLTQLLTTLLQAVVAVAMPILTAYGVKWFNANITQLANYIDNNMMRTYLQEIADAVATAVTCTSQTYVDALKQSDSFTQENQSEALNRALSEAKKLLSASAAGFIERSYGDIGTYLTAKIEQEVRNQKMQDAARKA